MDRMRVSNVSMGIFSGFYQRRRIIPVELEPW
jgi:hypothetical protein